MVLIGTMKGMGMIRAERLTADLSGDFVVFLIGMRINKPWKVHKWWPVASAMPRMLSELARKPELGFLNGHFWFGRTIICVQYWRSSDALMAYAKNRDGQHLPAWTAFNRAVGTNGDVGIWHETYEVSAGRYETVYANMPAFGLGRAGQLLPATGRRAAAGDRLKVSGRPDPVADQGASFG
jgi:hypothetical protein